MLDTVDRRPEPIGTVEARPPSRLARDWERERVKTSHVVVLGLGGIGSPCALGLAAASAGRLTVVDCDRVELCNLNGQFLYGASDVGRHKHVAAEEALRRLNPDLEVTSVSLRIESADSVVALLRGADFVVSAVDRPRRVIRLVVNEALRRAGVPGIFAYYNLPWIRVGPLVLPGRPGCEQCFELVMRSENPLYTAADASPLLGDPMPFTAPVSCIAAGLVVRLAVETVVTGEALAPPLLFFLNIDTLQTKTLTAGTRCSDCSKLE